MSNNEVTCAIPESRVTELIERLRTARAAAGIAGEGIVSAIAVRIGRGDVDLVRAQAQCIEVVASGRIGRIEHLDAVAGDRHTDRANAGAGIDNTPGEHLILSVVLGAG